MDLTRHVVVLDAADIAAVSDFWAALIGGGVVADDTFHCVVDGNGRWILGVQYAPDHQAPEWPDGNPQQIHLDLHVEDPVESLAHAIAVGARPLLAHDDPGGDEGFHVFADPAGHPFCIGWGHPSADQLARFLAENPPSQP